MRLAEGVAARDQRNGLLIVHRHATKGLANILRGRQRIRIAIRTLGIHIDQSHLSGPKRLFQFPVAAVALIAAKKLLLGSPVDRVRCPVIRASASKAEGLETHLLERDIPGQDHQITPGNLFAVFLLDRPQQSPCLVEICVVRPAVERLESLLSAPRAAATVTRAISAGSVPGHTDKERPVVAVVGRPPILRGRQDLRDVPLHGIEVKAQKRLRVVEVLSQRIGLGSVLPKRREVQLLGPPKLVWPRFTLSTDGNRRHQRQRSDRTCDQRYDQKSFFHLYFSLDRTQPRMPRRFYGSATKPL